MKIITFSTFSLLFLLFSFVTYITGNQIVHVNLHISFKNKKLPYSFSLWIVLPSLFLFFSIHSRLQSHCNTSSSISSPFLSLLMTCGRMGRFYINCMGFFLKRWLMYLLYHICVWFRIVCNYVFTCYSRYMKYKMPLLIFILNICLTQIFILSNKTKPLNNNINHL